MTVTEAEPGETEEGEPIGRRTFGAGLFGILSVGSFPYGLPWLLSDLDYGPGSVSTDSEGAITTVDEMWFDGSKGVLHLEGYIYAKSAGDFQLRMEARNRDGETVESHVVTKSFPAEESTEIHLKDDCGQGDYDSFHLRVRPAN